MRLLTGTAIVCATALFAFGCGDSASTSTSTTAADSDSVQDIASDEGTSSSEETSTDSASTGSDEVDALLAKADKTPYKVTYEMTGQGTGTDATKQTMSFAVNGEKIAIEVAGTRMIQDGTKITICAGGSCFESTTEEGDQGLGAAAASFLSARDALNDADADGLDKTDDRTIAGRDASCYRYSSSTLGANAFAESCIDKETGVMLSVSYGGESGGESGSFSVTATEVGTPDDADFEATGTSVKLPTPGADGQMSAEDAQKLVEGLQK